MTRRNFVRRGLLWVSASSLLPRVARAAIALQSHATVSAAGATPATTAAIDTSSANFLVIGATDYNHDSGIDTITDSLDGFSTTTGNTWALAKDQSTGSVNCAIWYSANPVVGASHQFRCVGNYPGFFVAAFSGVATSGPLDQANGNGVVGVTIQSGSVTPSTANQLIVSLVAINVAEANFSIDWGFTTTDSGGLYGAMAYLVQGTAAAINPAWTLPASSSCQAAIATFKAAGATTATTVHRVIG
jgi:hypothetical protein